MLPPPTPVPHSKRGWLFPSQKASACQGGPTAPSRSLAVWSGSLAGTGYPSLRFLGGAGGGKGPGEGGVEERTMTVPNGIYDVSPVSAALNQSPAGSASGGPSR